MTAFASKIFSAKDTDKRVNNANILDRCINELLRKRNTIARYVLLKGYLTMRNGWKSALIDV